MRALRQLLPTLLPQRQPERLLPRLVIHLVGVDLSTALAVAVDGPRTSLDLYLLDVPFVSHEERFYGGFLVVLFYQKWWLFTMGTFPLFPGPSVDTFLSEPNSLISGTSFRRGQDSPVAALFGSSQSPLGL